MRRLTFIFAFLAMALTLGLVLGPGPVRTGAQGSTPSAGAGFVGAWRLTIAEPGRAPFPALTTFAADGTLIGSDPPVEPASGGQPATISSAGHGVWHPTGPNTAQLTFVELATDLQGQFLGTATISSQLTLAADQNSFRGPFTVTVADPTGKVLFVGTGTVQATRITVQPMASPAQTRGRGARRRDDVLRLDQSGSGQARCRPGGGAGRRPVRRGPPGVAGRW